MNKKKGESAIFLFPVLAIYTVFFVIPVIFGILYSFTNWNAMSSTVEFIGLENYKKILVPNSEYFSNLIITLKYTSATVVLKTSLGLSLAIMLNKNVHTKNFLRGIFFLPNILSPLIIGILFISILSPDGIFNVILSHLGFSGFTKGWLAQANTVLGAVISVESWRMIGWNMVTLLAGLQVIPDDYYEAASIDGASAWQQFVFITIPSLMPTITIAVVMNVIHGIKGFDIVFAMTGGGPGSLTELINIAVFKEFSAGRYGTSTALGVVVFMITVIFALLVRKAMMREED